MATIDELALSHNWFRGNPELPFTALVDAYMADSLDLSTAVTKIVQPVNKKYSSGDTGMLCYATETQENSKARQKKRETSKLTTPHPDGKEPTTETLLWDLWYTILHAAKKISRTGPTPAPNPAIKDDKARAASLDPSLPSPGHEKLLSLLSTLKTQTPDPTAPLPDVQPPDDWIFRKDGKVWSVLLLFGPATREVLNDAPGAGSGYGDVELQAWGNLNAFLAHVARLGIMAGMETLGVHALRHALEQRHADDVKGKFQANEARKMEAFVAAAAVWGVVLGEVLWERKGEGESRRKSEDGVQAKGDAINRQRWKLWIERLLFMSCREDLDIGTRELAAQAAAIMGRVHA